MRARLKWRICWRSTACVDCCVARASAEGSPSRRATGTNPTYAANAAAPGARWSSTVCAGVWSVETGGLRIAAAVLTA
jgi:hypothetical protein